MRMILGLNLVSSQPPFSVGTGNLPETCGADGIREGCPLIRYQKNTEKGILSVSYQTMTHGAPESRRKRNESTFRQFTFAYYFR